MSIDIVVSLLYNVCMRVYRYMREGELNSLLQGDMDSVGCLCQKPAFDELSNSHKYEDGVRYLHFFLKKNDIEHAKTLYRNKEGNYYTCEFNIPITTLMKHVGVGWYSASGYDYDSVKAIEFAIPNNKISSEYLSGYIKDVSRHNQNKNYIENEMAQ